MPESHEQNRREGGISKIVGATPEEEREILEYEKELFENQKGKTIYIGEKELNVDDIERDKTPEEEEIIAGILKKMPEFIARYGGTPINISEKHIHIIDLLKLDEELQEIIKKSRKGGAHDGGQEFIYIYPDDNKVVFASKVVHETLHAESFQSFDKIKGERRLKARRYGFDIGMRGKSKTYYFDEINEAVIEKLSILFGKEYFSGIPAISGEVENTVIVNYRSARDKLDGLLEELYQKNRDEFNSEDEVFDIFARAVMSGNLLPVARLVEKVYGKGSFRRLGEMSKKEQ